METLADLFNAPRSAIRHYRHGHKPKRGHSPEYAVWAGMLARCSNSANPNYSRYGGRGIKVCDRWRADFINFLEDMGRRPPGCSIERINNNGDYEPGNCRWATAKEQANNRRSSRLIYYNGAIKTLTQWAEEAGIDHTLLHYRLKRGLPISRALHPPNPKIIGRRRRA
jgi:hypothetical protein